MTSATEEIEFQNRSGILLIGSWVEANQPFISAVARAFPLISLSSIELHAILLRNFCEQK